MEIQKYMSLMAIAMKVLGVTQGALTAVARASKDFPEQRPDGHYETVAVLEYLANRRTKGNKLRDKARLVLSDMRKSGRADDLGTNMDMAVRMARRMASGLSGSAVPTAEEAAKAVAEAKAEVEAEVEAETKAEAVAEANAAAKVESASMSSFPSLPKLGGVGSGNGDGDCDFDSILSQYRQAVKNTADAYERCVAEGDGSGAAVWLRLWGVAFDALGRAEERALDIGQRSGKLMPVDEAVAIVSRAYGNVRGKLLTLPQKLAFELAGVNTPGQAQKILDEEVREVLNGLAENPFADNR